MIAPVIIVTSDEPLLVMDTCDQLIAAAKAQGVSERQVVDVSDKFNWNDLLVENSSLSLFAESKLTDIRFSKSPDKTAQTAVVELVANADNDDQFLLRLPKIEKRQKNTKWFKALTEKAQLHELWPPKAHQFSGWIKQRAEQQGLNLATDAAQMLAELTEGNLLAAQQTLEKLLLTFPGEAIDLARINQVTADNARYSVFACLDEALAGHGEKAVRMLKKFEQEALAPMVILANLTREIDVCKNTALAMLKGQSAMQALSQSFLWDSKKKLVVAAVNRLPAVVWQRLMVRCAHLDRIIKGQEQGNIWLEFELCLWMISGKRIWGNAG